MLIAATQESDMNLNPYARTVKNLVVYDAPYGGDAPITGVELFGLLRITDPAGIDSVRYDMIDHDKLNKALVLHVYGGQSPVEAVRGTHWVTVDTLPAHDATGYLFRAAHSVASGVSHNEIEYDAATDKVDVYYLKHTREVIAYHARIEGDGTSVFFQLV